MNNNILIKPKKLNKGDTIGIVSPAGAVQSDNWEVMQNSIEGMGFRVKIAPHAKDKKDYLAGEDSDRLSDLIALFRDDEVSAIICARGGYGTHRLLENIDYSVIRDNPKIFVGYSDITALHSAFLNHAGLVTFHGPLAISDFGSEQKDDYTINNFLEIAQGRVELPYDYVNQRNYTLINSGKCRGKLFCANLAMLCSLSGTPYFPDLKDYILVLEDIAEPLYKIDRMLMQLKLSGVLGQLKGLLFADFTLDDKDTFNNDFIRLVHELLGDLPIPIGYGFNAGHERTKATLPLGVKYEFCADEGILSIVEDYLTCN